MGWAWIKKCPVFCVLTVSGLLFSLAGIVGRFTMYRGYEFHAVKQPFLALVMEGIDEGIAPWEAMGFDISVDGLAGDLPSGDKGEAETMASGGGRGQNIEDFAGEGSGMESGMDTAAGPGTGSGGAVGNAPGGGNTEGGAGSGPAGGNVSGGNGADGSAAGAEDTDGKAADSMPDGGGQEAGSGPAEGNGGPAGSAGGDGAAGAGTEGAVAYEFREVTEEYFNDAVFIGDSRTVGLYEYGGIEMRADFFAKISLTIYDIFTEKVAKDEETGKKITVEEALQKKQYGKVYLMLGINELGTGTTESFMEEYAAAVGRIRELQPDAVIFVEGIMRVTGTKDESDPIFNNTNINEKNDAIAGLANNRDIFYIDVNEVVCDERGNLKAEYTTDEVHLKAKYYEIWLEFLMKHGVSIE